MYKTLCCDNLNTKIQVLTGFQPLTPSHFQPLSLSHFRLLVWPFTESLWSLSSILSYTFVLYVSGTIEVTDYVIIEINDLNVFTNFLMIKSYHLTHGRVCFLIFYCYFLRLLFFSIKSLSLYNSRRPPNFRRPLTQVHI